MFNFFKKQDKSQQLINQVVGGQSVIFRIFKEVFEEENTEVSKADGGPVVVCVKGRSCQNLLVLDVVLKR